MVHEGEVKVGSPTALINRQQLMGRKGANEKLFQSSDEVR